MANVKTDPLFQLIKSLSKSEKRNFKLYARRLISNEDAKFLKLFDTMDRMAAYDEHLILQRAPVTKLQLANMKAHLYKQILISLRLKYTDIREELQLREQIDFARILYNKGLYMQSLKLLEKAKVLASQYNQDLMGLEVVEFEKLIESQHITRSLSNRADQLATESSTLCQQIHRKNALSNLALKLYGLYLKVGYVRSEKDKAFVEAFYNANLPSYEIEKLSFDEKLFLYQAQVWYYHIMQDFPLCYRSAQHWVDLYEEYPLMKKINTGSYLKGYHYLLDTLFYLQRYSKFRETLDKFSEDIECGRITLEGSTETLARMYLYTNRINKHFMEGTFSKGVNEVLPGLLAMIDERKPGLDPHHILVLYYKIACLYFGSGDNLNAIAYLKKVTDCREEGLREDLQCFARILHLIALYEEGLDEHLEYQIKSVYKFIVKMNELHQVQQEIMLFVRNLGRIYEYQLKDEFKKLRSRLLALSEHPYEKRAFLYLDIISWLESKIENRTVQEVIQGKFASTMR